MLASAIGFKSGDGRAMSQCRLSSMVRGKHVFVAYVLLVGQRPSVLLRCIVAQSCALVPLRLKKSPCGSTVLVTIAGGSLRHFRIGKQHSGCVGVLESIRVFIAVPRRSPICVLECSDGYQRPTFVG